MDKPDKKIPLVEMFGPTIQGEGNVIGQQTYFLRFGLCDYRCEMCDSLHAVIPSEVKKNATWLTQEEIFERFWEFRKPNTTNWVTFSGGNPAIHDLSILTQLIQNNNMRINVETQGTKWLPWLSRVDNLTISPKGPGMGEKHNQEVFNDFITQYSMAMRYIPYRPICFKVVVFDQRDLEFAKDIYRYLEKEGFMGLDYIFYLSLGNVLPPNPDGTPPEMHFDGKPLTGNDFRNTMLANYRLLCEDIMQDAILSKMRFLPQWHTFVWGNDQGH